MHFIYIDSTKEVCEHTRELCRLAWLLPLSVIMFQGVSLNRKLESISPLDLSSQAPFTV